MMGMLTGLTTLSALSAEQVFNWTGAAGDNNWSTSGNWEGGVVPTLPAGSNTPIINIPTQSVVTEITNTPNWVNYSLSIQWNIGANVKLHVSSEGANTNIGSSNFAAGSDFTIQMNGTGGPGLKTAQGATVDFNGNFTVKGGADSYGTLSINGDYGTNTNYSTANFNAGSVTTVGTLNAYTKAIVNINGGTINATSFTAHNTSEININAGSILNLSTFRSTGATITMSGGRLVTDTFSMGNGNTNETTLIMTGGDIIINGTANSGYAGGNSFMLGEYDVHSALNISGGTISALGATMQARDGRATVNLSNTGVINVLGIDSRYNASITINLGTQEDGGRLNIGASGINSNTIMNLGSGTIGSLANWTCNATLNTTLGKRTIFNLSDAVDGSNRHITLNGALTGGGNISFESNKASSTIGKVSMNADSSSYSGGIFLKNAELEINHANALGNGILMVASKQAVISGGVSFTNSVYVMGNSTLTMNNTVSLAASQFTLQLSQANSNSAMISMTGNNIDFSTGSISFDMSLMEGMQAGDVFTFTLIDSDVFDLSSLTGDNFTFTDEFKDSWKMIDFNTVNGGQSSTITVQYIPEPSVAMLALFGFGSLLIRRRRIA